MLTKDEHAAVYDHAFREVHIAFKQTIEEKIIMLNRFHNDKSK